MNNALKDYITKRLEIEDSALADVPSAEKESLLDKLEPDEKQAIESVDAMINEHKIEIASGKVKANRTKSLASAVTASASQIPIFFYDNLPLDILSIGGLTAGGIGVIFFSIKARLQLKREDELKFKILQEQASPAYTRGSNKIMACQILQPTYYAQANPSAHQAQA